MHSLIAITNSASSEFVENLLKPMLDIRVMVATDVDLALQDVFTVRPSMVCIQSQIPGITAVGFAHHIKKILGYESPTFVLMHEGGDTVGSIRGGFDYLLDLSLPREKLEEAAEAIFISILGAAWEQVGKRPTTRNELVVVVDDDPFLLVDSLDEPKVPMQAAPGDVMEPSAAAKLDAADIGLLPKKSSKETGRPPYPEISKEQREPIRKPAVAAPFFEESPRPRLGNKLCVALTMAFAVAVFVQGYPVIKSRLLPFLHPKATTASSNNREAFARARAALPAPKEGRKGAPTPSPPPSHPGFIPVEGRDPAFSEKNPGWERYVGENYDYRIFKADGRTKAVQILGIKGNAITLTVLKRILLELTGSSEYSVTSQSNKGGYRIVRGKVGDKADVMIYENKSKLYAVVVSLS